MIAKIFSGIIASIILGSIIFLNCYPLFVGMSELDREQLVSLDSEFYDCCNAQGYFNDPYVDYDWNDPLTIINDQKYTRELWEINADSKAILTKYGLPEWLIKRTCNKVDDY
jgi:hypothetical protein